MDLKHCVSIGTILAYMTLRVTSLHTRFQRCQNRCIGQNIFGSRKRQGTGISGVVFDPALNRRRYHRGFHGFYWHHYAYFLNNNDVTTQGENESIRFFRDADKEGVWASTGWQKELANTHTHGWWGRDGGEAAWKLIQTCGHRLRGCFGSPRTILTCVVRREHKEKRFHHGGPSPTENPWLELGCPRHFLSPSVVSGRWGYT